MEILVIVVHVPGDGPVRIAQERTQVHAAQVHADGHVTPVHLPRDRAGPGGHPDLGDLRKRNFRAAAVGKHQRPDLFGRVPVLFVQPAGHVVRLTADENLRYGASSDRELDQLGHIRNIQPVLCDPVAVGDDLQLRQRRLLVHRHVDGSRHRPERLLDPLGDAPGFMQVFAVDLHGEIAVRPGHLVHHHVDDRLRKTDRISRHFLQLDRHRID